MVAHRIPSKKSRSPDTVRQKASAVLRIPREKSVNGPGNGLRYTLNALDRAARALADARYNVGFRVGAHGTATRELSRRESVATSRYLEALDGARALLRAFAGGGA